MRRPQAQQQLLPTAEARTAAPAEWRAARAAAASAEPAAADAAAASGEVDGLGMLLLQQGSSTDWSLNRERGMAVLQAIKRLAEATSATSVPCICSRVSTCTTATGVRMQRFAGRLASLETHAQTEMYAVVPPVRAWPHSTKLSSSSGHACESS